MATARKRKPKSKPKPKTFVCSKAPTVTASVVPIQADEGTYRVTIVAPDQKAVRHKIYRDTQSRNWQEDRPAHVAHSLTYLGDTMDEAVQRLMGWYADRKPASKK